MLIVRKWASAKVVGPSGLGYGMSTTIFHDPRSSEVSGKPSDPEYSGDNSPIIGIPEPQWILGFDGLCGKCSDIATQISMICGDRIEVADLREPAIFSLRSQALHANAPWLPVLFQADGGRLRAFTGTKLMARLAFVVGPSNAWKIAKMIGETTSTRSSVHSDEPRFGRRKAIVGLSGIVAGLAISTRDPNAASAYSANACGVNWYVQSSTRYAGPGGVKCRTCPTTAPGDTNVAAIISEGAAIGFRGFTTSGEPVYFGNQTWWRTSGTTGCWVYEEVLA